MKQRIAEILMFSLLSTLAVVAVLTITGALGML
jgi:hypothetical protein